MNTFLSQPEATFYHITPLENWERIKNEGLTSNNNRIFVSRVGELPVLLAIAIEQIPEIYESDGIAILKLPQSKNNFELNEIIMDTQARVEWTQPFQNIILKNHIPSENTELMMELRFGNEGPFRGMLISQLISIANAGRVNYQNHSISERALNFRY
jgi:hypothetical protein